MVTRPDGSSNNYRFYMHDDGQFGDETADDGTYSIGILAPSPTSQTGDYIFRFYAFDLDRHNSNNPEAIITAY
jgi:hypothetical protein